MLLIMMALINLCIALLAGCSAGILAWLFMVRFYDSLQLFKESYTETTANRFSDMFMFVNIRKFFYVYIGLLCTVPLLVWLMTDNILIAFLVLLLVLIAPHVILKKMWQRRVTKFKRQLPDALLMLSSSLKSGSSLSQAMENVAQESEPPLSQEFKLFSRQRKLGVDMATAMDQLEKRMMLEDLAMLLSAIQISQEVGGNLATTLANMAETLRQKLTMEGRIASLTAQGRLQGVVMSLLPMLLLVVLMKLEPKAMGLMFTTGMGWAAFGLIIAMQLLGYLSIRKITQIDV